MQVQDGLELFPKPLGHHHIMGSHSLEQQVIATNHPNHTSLSMTTGQTRHDEHARSHHYNGHHHQQQQSNVIEEEDEEEEECEDTEEDEDGESESEEERMKSQQQHQQQTNLWQGGFNGRQEYGSAPSTYEQFEAAHFGGNDFSHKGEYGGYGAANGNAGQSSNAQTDRETTGREKGAEGSNNGGGGGSSNGTSCEGASPMAGVTYYSQFPTPESGSENGSALMATATPSTVSNESLQLVPLGGGTTTMASTSAVGVTPNGSIVESETYFAERRRTYSFLSPHHTTNSNSSTSSSSSTTSEPTSFGSSFPPYSSAAATNGTGNDSSATAAANSNRNYVMMQSSIINQSNHYHHHYHHYHYYCPNMHQPYHHHHPLLPPPPPPPHPSLHAYSASHPPSSTSPTLSSGSSSSMGAPAVPSSVPQLAPPALPPPTAAAAVLVPALQTPTAYPALPWHTNSTGSHLQASQSLSNGYHHHANGYINGHHHPGQHGPFDDDQSMTSVSNLSYPESPKCEYFDNNV